MASSSAFVQSAASDRDTAQLVKEHSHAFQNRLNTTQTDSPPISKTGKSDIDADQPKAEAGLEAHKPTPETKPPVTEPTEPAPGSVPIARQSQIPVGPKDETVAGGTVAGEKRDIDSTGTPTPALAEDEGQQKPKPSDEPDTKKLKTDEKPVSDSNGTAVAPSNTENGAQKKASRSKKEKIKDAVNKVVPGDGIGSRTRSRTKGA
ncbi:hypothetical protein N7527_009833 [Penicillium freii]|uniref:Uncharacterized protein n=1 Tax=Penicillium freii TaxID=48697 RepID=A0A101MMI1_PENFR|nr:hypothetical protein N7527_009833 [Penicillium freii]KUM63282.1 hypothetical protein ACN42_g3835 [Penicillium freii]